MDLGKQLLFFFGALGTFNGGVLSLYFFLLTKKRLLTNYLLGAMILAMSISLSMSVFGYFNPGMLKIYSQIGSSASFYVGPLLYLFLKAATSGTNQMQRSWKFMLCGLSALVLLIGLIRPYEVLSADWCKYIARTVYVQWFAFLTLAGFEIKDRIRQFFEKHLGLKAQDKWLLTIYGGNLLIFGFYVLSLTGAPFSTCINGAIVFSFMLYIAIFILLYRKKTDDLFQFIPEKTTNRKLDPAMARVLIEKVEKIMATEKIYKDPDLKLGSLARAVGISPHQLSQLLNDYLENNFTTYVNSYRIEDACILISGDNKLTLESIGYEVGFNSKSTFFAAFKKHTGMTPLSHQQQSTLINSTVL